MKRTFFIPVIVLSLLFGLPSLWAQDMLQPIPIDSSVRYGTLENGLTYYIRHNKQPKERAEFFIAQKVGSVLEEDSQAGLAHFLEHMAFNGLQNFPDKTMINYLEAIGVKFGENLNAYTGFDETVYNISNVPVIREGIVDSCLLVLHGWSSFISLQEKEIEKERGVIREEMRSRNHANYRQLEKLLPIIMPGSQYANRMPIGTEEVIMNFKPEELRAYYRKWYRPDLQAVIIIGDIDVDQIENKIKKLFADIPKPVDPATRIYYPVPDNDEPIVGIMQDKESTRTLISLNYKHEPMPDNVYASTPGLVMNYIKSVISRMLNARFAEISEKANPPFIYAGANHGEFLVAKTKDAWNFSALAKEEGIENALKSITREIQRVKQFGFTASEYEREKINVLKSYENLFNEREKTKNNNYAREYVDHFINGGYIPGIEYEYNKMQEIAPHITVEYLNQYFDQIIGDKNVVLYLTTQEKEGLEVPSEATFLSWYKDAQKETLEAYEDKVSDEPLMTELPSGGKITKVVKDQKLNTTNYELSNGVKVIIKQTTFKDDEILMRATSEGGSSLFPETDVANIKAYRIFSNIGGLRNFSAIDLQKVLAGKKVNVQPNVAITHEMLSGNSSPKDFETMLQLIYLNFTDPRIDDEVFQSYKERLHAQLKSQEANPAIALTDTLNITLYQKPERNARLKPEEFDLFNYQTIMDWRKDRYKDAGDFTFIFVGNINPAEVEPLIAQYLGSLPSIKRKETYRKDINIAFNGGIIKKDFDKEMEDPKTTIVNMYSGSLQPTLSNRVQMDILQQILRIVYTEKVREDEGGTYGVRVSGGISDYPQGQAYLQISFETNAEKKSLLNEIIHREFALLAQDGPRVEDFNKVKEFMLKKQMENEQENGYWAGVIENMVEYKYDSYTNYTNTLQKITVKDIQNFTSSLYNQKNLVEVIMTGVKK